METEVIVKVTGDTALEVASKIQSIQTLAAAPLGDDLVDVDIGDEEAPGPAPARPGGLIDVGEASGKRGDEVAVEIRGHADVVVMGFAAAIGFESRDLEFQKVVWGEIWGNATPIAWNARGRKHPFVGNAGPHVALNIARFVIKSTDPQAEDPGDTLEPVLVPQGTLLATLLFKILEGASVGQTLPLLNWSTKFGSPRIVTEFMTLREHGPSVKPELGDGQVVVTG